MDGRATTLLSIAMLVAFAYLSSYYPQHLWTFFIAYFALAMAAALLMGGRTASSLLKDMEHIKKGRILLSVTREEVSRLRAKDKLLNKELNKQALAMMPQIIIFVLSFIIILVPAVRDLIINFIEYNILILNLDATITRFITFILFYGILMLIFQAGSRLTQWWMDREGGRLEIPLSYIVTESGLLLDGRVPLKAPLKALDLKVDTRRRFVELKVKTKVGVVSRYRLYYEDPRALERALNSLLAA